MNYPHAHAERVRGSGSKPLISRPVLFYCGGFRSADIYYALAHLILERPSSHVVTSSGASLRDSVISCTLLRSAAIITR